MAGAGVAAAAPGAPGVPAGPGALAQGGATGSPGVASGNEIQVPISGPVNVCGNNVDAAELLGFDVPGNC
ncbi:chaplin [Streptomyces sp. XD-27]|uniref:chaplin n=1 Tax=Streptomyces sp. XD-27 TaxID=3062779 RepID=UPI00350E3F00